MIQSLNLFHFYLTGCSESQMYHLAVLRKRCLETMLKVLWKTCWDSDCRSVTPKNAIRSRFFLALSSMILYRSSLDMLQTVQNW